MKIEVEPLKYDRKIRTLNQKTLQILANKKKKNYQDEDKKSAINKN